MNGSPILRTVVILSVWSLSAAGALYLVHGSRRVAGAPAQVMAREFRLAPVETGRVAAVFAVPGQRVLGGETIARMDTSVLEREIAVAEARLRQLGSETAASEAALESDGYQTERSFQSDFEDASAQLDAARAAQAQQAAELRQVREDLVRQQGYLREGLVRRDRVDELDLRMKALEESAAQWPARIAGLEARREAARGRLADWRSRYSAHSAPAPRQVRVEPLRKRTSEQIEALRVLRVRLNNANITAPADAAVVSVLANPGDVVRAGDAFVVLNGAGSRYVVAYVNERQGTQLRTGAPALLRRRTPAREEFSGQVTRVAASVSPLPARFWLAPQLAEWGREVVIEPRAGAPLDPGEALDAIFVEGDER